MDPRVKKIKKINKDKYSNEVDCLDYISNYNKIENFLIKLYEKDRTTYDNLSDEAIAILHHRLEEQSCDFNRYYIENLINNCEYDYRNLFEEIYSFTPKTIDELINDFETHDYKHLESKKFMFMVLHILKDVGNPILYKRSNEFLICHYYFLFLEFKKLSIEEQIEVISFHYYDALYIAISYCADELLYTINSIFDAEIDSPNKLIIEFIQQIIDDKKVLTNKKNRMHITEQIAFLDSIKVRKNRDRIYKELSFLKNKENISNSKKDENLYFPDIQISKNQKINNCKMKDLKEYFTEGTKCTAKTFRSNLKLIEEYFEIMKLNELDKIGNYVPIPNVILANNLLNYKILYHEFIVLDREHIKTKSDKYSKTNISTRNMIINSISTVKSIQNGEDINDSLFLYKYNTESMNGCMFNDIKNERYELLYYQITLFTEKIRSGLYREYNQMEIYKKIFDFNIFFKNVLMEQFENMPLIDLILWVTDLYDEIYKSFQFYSIQVGTQSWKKNKK